MVLMEVFILQLIGMWSLNSDDPFVGLFLIHGTYVVCLVVVVKPELHVR